MFYKFKCNNLDGNHEIKSIRFDYKKIVHENKNIPFHKHIIIKVIAYTINCAVIRWLKKQCH